MQRVWITHATRKTPYNLMTHSKLEEGLQKPGNETIES